MKKADVFISYNSKEFEKAEWVRTVLETNGIICWMAPADIPGGSNYAKEIPVAIKTCKVFVLILSEKAQESKWVPKELDMAISSNKIIMPFMLENCTLRDDFNFYLSNIQRYEAFEDKSRAAEKMVREIKSILNAKKSEKTEKTAKKIPEEKADSEEEKIPVKKEEYIPEKKAGKSRKPVKKSRIIIPVAVVALIVAAVALIGAFSKVTVGSEKYKKDTDNLKLSGETITEEYAAEILELKKLTRLSFEKCTFEGQAIEKLNSLAQLQTLSLKECGIDDSGIKKLDFEKFSKLYTLDVSGNPEISDMSAVKPAADTLKELNISDTGITDISFVRDLKLVDKLYADNLKLKSAEPLSALTDIRELGINGCGIKSLDFMKGMDDIKILCANKNELKNLKGAEKCIWLSLIELSENRLEDISALSNATQIETIYLDNNNLSDISVLVKSAAKLKNLIISHNKLQNSDILSKLTALENLDISYNNLILGIDLRSCDGLEKLSASNDHLLAFPKFSQKALLSYLDLSENNIMGKPAGTVNLEYGTLDIHGNIINDVSAFFEHNNQFNYADLSENRITSYGRGADSSCLIVDYSDKLDIKAMKDGTVSLIIKGCPLDKQAEITKEYSFSVYFYENNDSKYEKPSMGNFRNRYYIY